MYDKISFEEAHKGQNLLMELLQEVSEEVGVLSGGTRSNADPNAVLGLRNATVKLGNPQNHLIHLDSKSFDSMGLKLTDICKRQLRDQFDFYYMTLAVSIQSAYGIPFRELRCSLEFGPKGMHEPIIQSLSPKRKWTRSLRVGGGLSLILNSNLDLKIDAKVPLGTNARYLHTDTSGSGKANFCVIVDDFAFEVGRVEVTARGEGGPDCYWLVKQPRLQEMQDIHFGVVFKVPKGTTSIELEGLAVAVLSSMSIYDHIRDIFENISNKFQVMFRRAYAGQSKREDIMCKLDHESWMIMLPR